jgi:hypothetical protein
MMMMMQLKPWLSLECKRNRLSRRESGGGASPAMNIFRCFIETFGQEYLVDAIFDDKNTKKILDIKLYFIHDDIVRDQLDIAMENLITLVDRIESLLNGETDAFSY